MDGAAGSRALRDTAPVPVAFETTATVSAGARAGKAVALLTGADGKAKGFSVTGNDIANEASFAGVPRQALRPVGPSADGSGQPQPVARVSLRNRGALWPQDLGVPIVDVTLSFAPTALQPGGDLPLDTEAFQITFGAMWSPGPGSAPNNMGTFSLVGPPPSVDFVAYSVRHRLRITGLVAVAAEGGLADNRKLWWNKDDTSTHGFGAVVVPKDGNKYAADVLAELSIV